MVLCRKLVPGLSVSDATHEELVFQWLSIVNEWHVVKPCGRCPRGVQRVWHTPGRSYRRNKQLWMVL